MAPPDVDYEQYLATVAAMLTTEGMDEAASLLKNGKFRVEETGYDNWNGGTTIYTVYLTVAPAVYARLRSRRVSLEKQISERLKPVIEQFTSDWVSITIAPAVQPQPEWRETDDSVSREVRQNIIDGLKLEDVRWSGRLDEVEFLQRLFDLQAMPSGDSRFKDAAGDIWQHRFNNPGDWEPDWVYRDVPSLSLRDDSSGCPTRSKRVTQARPAVQ
jgi:AbiJ N-terminal domain 3